MEADTEVVQGAPAAWHSIASTSLPGEHRQRRNVVVEAPLRLLLPCHAVACVSLPGEWEHALAAPWLDHDLLHVFSPPLRATSLHPTFHMMALEYICISWCPISLEIYRIRKLQEAN